MNTYEKVVGYLKLYRKLYFDIIFYNNKLQGIKGITYSKDDNGYTEKSNMIGVYMQKIEDAKTKQKEIERFIEMNFDKESRIIIYERYCNNRTFKQIGNMVGYSRSHVKCMLDKAIYRYLAK